MFVTITEWLAATAAKSANPSPFIPAIASIFQPSASPGFPVTLHHGFKQSNPVVEFPRRISIWPLSPLSLPCEVFHPGEPTAMSFKPSPL